MLPLRLTLFGGFDAQLGAHAPGSFPTDKARALLAFLAVESGRPHRRDALAGLLWPDLPNEDARRNLRKTLFHLKKTLEGAWPDGLEFEQLIQAARDSIQLDPRLVDLDARNFHAALEAVQAHRHHSLAACPACMAHLEECVRLYAGEFLAGFYLSDAPGFDDWVHQQRESASRKADAALAALTEACLNRGEPQAAQEYAARQLALNPLQEAAHRAMMRALAAQGKRAEALAHYETCRRILDEELGEAPDAQTEALRRQIAAETLQPLAPAAPGFHHFPAQTTRFFGRTELIEAAVRHLAEVDCRLLTLVGPGGVGKSRLAGQVARRLAEQKAGFPDGIYYVPLASIGDAQLVETAIGMSLGVEFSGQASPGQQLRAHLAGRQVLLVLDNFEHLASIAARFTDLLSHCPGVKLLVTSRAPLHLQSERRLRVEGLAYPPDSADAGQPLEQYEAVQLFLHAVERLHPEHPPCEDLHEAAEICRLVHGSPLALEMAAALTRMYTCAELAARITAGPDALSASFQDVPERHRSMRAVFESSWALLSREEQAVLARLSVFRGPFGMAAAQAAADASPEVVAALVDKSVVQWPERDRFALHPLLQQFLAEKRQLLEESEQPADQTETRHARYYLGLVAQEAARLGTSQSEAAQAVLTRVLDDIRAAWDWAVAHRMITEIADCLEGLMRFFMLSGLIREREELTAAAARSLSAGFAPQNELWARVLYQLHYFNANSRGILNQFEAALESALAALGFTHHLEEPILIANVQGLIGHLYQDLGNYRKALDFQEQALELLRGEQAPARLALLLVRTGASNYQLGRYDQAHACYRQAYDLYTGMDYQPGIADALSGMGIVAYYRKQYADAVTYNRQAEEIDRRLGNKIALVRHAANLGLVLQARGDRTEALAAYRRALAINAEIGSDQFASLLCTGIGSLLLDQGESEEARDWLEKAIRISREAGDRYNLAEALIEHTRLMLTLDRLPEAQRDHAEAAEIIGKIEAIHKFFQIRFLDARLLAARDAAAAVERLQGLRQVFLEDDQQAAVLDELWQLTGERAFAEQAAVHYRALLERFDHPDHRVRLEVLSRL